jgi:hypothetical protein
MKSDKKMDEEGTIHIEDISELATWLELPEEQIDEDWTSSLV